MASFANFSWDEPFAQENCFNAQDFQGAEKTFSTTEYTVYRTN
jgi:hypothetical protein